jgi:hypothetical protein
VIVSGAALSRFALFRIRGRCSTESAPFIVLPVDSHNPCSLEAAP